MKNMIFLLSMMLGCAGLERDSSAPIPSPDAPTVVVDTPDAMPPSDGPDQPTPDACEPPKPECECSADCGDDMVCIEGTCHQVCDCDFDCGNHYECHSHVCYNPHGD